MGRGDGEKISMNIRPAVVSLTALTLLPLASCATADVKSEACPPPVTSLRPILSTQTPMPYPPISQRLGEQGVTVMTVTIRSDGAPTDVVVKQTSGSDRLDSAAKSHIWAHWRWQPLTQGCSPATATVNVAWHIVKGPIPESGLTMLQGIETMTIYTPHIDVVGSRDAALHYVMPNARFVDSVQEKRLAFRGKRVAS